MGNLSKKSQHQVEPQPQFTCQVCLEPLTLSINNKLKDISNISVHPFCANCVIRYIRIKRKDLTCDQSLKDEIAHQLFHTWCDELFESVVLKFEDGLSSIMKEDDFDQKDKVAFVVLSDSNGLMKCPACTHCFTLWDGTCTLSCRRCRSCVCCKCRKEKDSFHSCNHQTLVTCLRRSLDVITLISVIYILYLIGVVSIANYSIFANLQTHHYQ